MAVSGDHTITGLRPSTEYRVTLEVDGVDPEHNAVTVVIRTTAAPTATTRPSTPTTVTVTTTTNPTTSSTTPGEFNVPGGIPTPPGPSAGG
jgi:hypothetical protein